MGPAPPELSAGRRLQVKSVALSTSMLSHHPSGQLDGIFPTMHDLHGDLPVPLPGGLAHNASNGHVLGYLPRLPTRGGSRDYVLDKPIISSHNEGK